MIVKELQQQKETPIKDEECKKTKADNFKRQKIEQNRGQVSDLAQQRRQ